MQITQFSSLTVNSELRALRRAFTLIELLVVIAIITILIALLFPVFATARENARESSTITHMQQIQSGLALYKLDNQQYPQVLFGYAVAGKPMSDASDIGAASEIYGSLYPTYVNDFHVFMSQDNPIDDQLSQTVTLDSTELQSCTVGSTGCSSAGTILVPTQRSFYIMDGFDISPQIPAPSTSNEFINGNSPDDFRYVLRYQRDWTNVQSLTDTGLFGTSPDYDQYYTNYLHQLRWHNPPADSYVTSVTYHVPNANKIIVLFESGSAIKMQATQYGGYNDATSCWNTATGGNIVEMGTGSTPSACTTNANGDNPATFWQVANTQ